MRSPKSRSSPRDQADIKTLDIFITMRYAHPHRRKSHRFDRPRDHDFLDLEYSVVDASFRDVEDNEDENEESEEQEHEVGAVAPPDPH